MNAFLIVTGILFALDALTRLTWFGKGELPARRWDAERLNVVGNLLLAAWAVGLLVGGAP